MIVGMPCYKYRQTEGYKFCALALFTLLCVVVIQSTTQDSYHEPAERKPPRGIDRYVSLTGNDADDGSARHPWRTIQHAAHSAQSGMTVHVAPATYYTTSIIINSSSGTATDRIRFVSDQRWGAKIITSASQGWVTTGTYIDIEGFDFSASGTNTSILIHGQGQYDRLIGNKLHDMTSPMDTCPSGGGIVVGGGMDNQSVIGNIVYNIGQPPSAKCNQTHGIYISTSHNVIENNVCFANGDLGIHIWGSGPSHNIVINNTLFANWRGIVIGSASSTPADYNFVANNIVYNHFSAGLYETGTTGTHNKYTHNLVYQNHPDWALVNGTSSNTVAAEPQFVNYNGTISGDYHLQPGSPAITHGTVEHAPYTDVDLNQRKKGSSPDIGAYGWSPVALRPREPSSDNRHPTTRNSQRPGTNGNSTSIQHKLR
jgi:parallel beta-helix repeat protein